VASLERLKFEVFSDIEFKMPGHWEHRGKGVASTQNELLKRWLAKDAQVADLQNANRAAVVVHDGVGLAAKRLECVNKADEPIIFITPDNKNYKSYECKLTETNIIGKIIWFSRAIS
jgi:hypothetical protein